MGKVHEAGLQAPRSELPGYKTGNAMMISLPSVLYGLARGGRALHLSP